MNASAQAVDERYKGDTTAAYDSRRPRSTRPLDGTANNSQAANELAETLKRIVASATMLLDVRSCWIAGIDPANSTLIPIAALSQEAPEAARLRAALHLRVASWVIAHRIFALINNVLSDPRCQGPGYSLGGSMLCLPLFSGRQLLGTITVSSSSPGTFDQQAFHVLQVLADQTALAISRARQIEASHRQARQLDVFQDVARAVTSTQDALQVLRSIVIEIRRLVFCDEAVIFAFAEEVQELRAVVRLGAYKAESEDLRIPISDKQSVAAWVAQKRRPILHDPGGRVFLGRVTQELLGGDDLAVLGVPLLSKNQLKGVAMLTRFTSFDAGELHTIQGLSSSIIIALERLSVQDAITETS